MFLGELWVVTLGTSCGHLFAFALTRGARRSRGYLGAGKCRGDGFLLQKSAHKHFIFSSRYIERKAFLDRVDHRQFEIERDLRLSKMKP